MKSQKFIAGIISLILLTFQSVFAIEANNNFELKTISNNGKELVVELNVINPSSQQIASVQSWLYFDKTKLKGIEINTEGSPFDFVIPGESDFEGNLVKIGRSTLGSNTAQEKVFVARIKFAVLNQGETEIKFYDYKTDDSGHVSIQVFDNGFPINTLSGDPLLLKINLSSPINTLIANNSMNSLNNNFSDNQLQVDTGFPRPTDVKLSTEGSSVTLKWNTTFGAENYYLYYGKISGRYLHRRLVGNVDSYKIEGLEVGKQYFFAITAVSELNKESDYSDEVGAVVGNALSPTSLLTENKIINKVSTSSNDLGKVVNKEVKQNDYSKSANIVKAKETTKSGPNEIMIISMILALIFTLFLMRKRLIKLVINN